MFKLLLLLCPTPALSTTIMGATTVQGQGHLRIQGSGSISSVVESVYMYVMPNVNNRVKPSWTNMSSMTVENILPQGSHVNSRGPGSRAISSGSGGIFSAIHILLPVQLLQFDIIGLLWP